MKDMTIENIAATELAHMIDRNDVLLIDVREEHEFAAGHIAGAELFPLSRFNPFALPDPHGKKAVLYCAAGVRSANAVAACEAAGIAISAHLSGGIHAWVAAGLPIED